MPSRDSHARARLAGVSRIAYVSGRPGAGKSSLASPLAAELGYSLVTTVDTTGPVDVAAVAAEVRRLHAS